MTITKALGRIGTIILAVTATIAVGQTTPPSSVKIGTLTWTKQNLNVKTEDSWCYENDSASCAKYGRLYTYDAAKSVCLGMGGKWRLPTNSDWDNLMKAAGGVRKADEYGNVAYNNAGKKLKSKGGWNSYDGKSGNGTDDYGFEALPGGYSSSANNFVNAGYNAFWWSATAYGNSDAYSRYMLYDDDNVVVDDNNRGYGFSVRCVAP